MSTRIRTVLGCILLLAVSASLPLSAQLDTRLQGSNTDFLDLYQQSTQTKVKPEILTIFDFSTSMRALMFHPLYVNSDTTDNGTAYYMRFSVSSSSSGSTTTYSAIAWIGGDEFQYLSGGKLVKPDGSLVTQSDAAAASTSSGLYGASSGAADIRNWVRAASHARFTKNVSGTTRTIDIPIAWKVMSSSSTGNPLSSYTVTDKQVVTNSDGTTTTYGTGSAIEVDTLYSLDKGGYVLSGSSGSILTTTYNTFVTYKAAYIDWLFSGTYAVGSYSGKYIVFDAANASLAGGQNAVADGQGFGASAASYTIKVPDYNLNGTYAGTETTKSGSTNVLPALNRIQATKRAAIQTWINYQANVLWAFRYLDVSGDAGSGTGNKFDNNSQTTYHNTYYGNDSGWHLLNGKLGQCHGLHRQSTRDGQHAPDLRHGEGLSPVRGSQ